MRRALAGLLSALPLIASSLAQVAPAPDPSRHAEVLSAGEAQPLQAGDGWMASLVHESDAGIWTVKSFDLHPQLGYPEVVGLDDKGRATICIGYSGAWTAIQTVEDREWLGAAAQVDLDERVPGPELYVSGKRGNLYQITPRLGAAADVVLVAQYPGLEIHTLVGGDLDISRAGQEMLAFGMNGEVFELRRAAKGGAGFESTRIATLEGRVRDAIILEPPGRVVPEIAVVSRSGHLKLLRMLPAGLDQETIAEEPIGFGRIARRPPRKGAPEVLYACRDDGVVLRFEAGGGATWAREVCYAGPQGPRGLAAGRFDADPARETIAVFGYSKRVTILARDGAGRWSVSDAFEDVDKGHWLHAAELDGRNGTDELLASGYGKRIVLLARPPGYGIPGAAIDAPKRETPVARESVAEVGSDAPPEEAAWTAPAVAEADEGPRPPRIGVPASGFPMESLSPLSYRGGFEAKTALYETLVRRDKGGNIVPGLATSWRIDGRSITFELREGATFHDGSPVDAEAVRQHVLRWRGLPEHAWLRTAERLRDVIAVDPRHLRFELSEPCAVLAELCAINPCSIRAPSSLDGEGGFVKPVGSGPFRFVELADDKSVLRLESVAAPGREVDLVAIGRGDRDALMGWLARGELDGVAACWAPLLEPHQVDILRADPRYRVVEGAGSAVVYLSFAGRGATAELKVRRAITAAIDAGDLVRDVESGHAEVCSSWAAPDGGWPIGVEAIDRRARAALREGSRPRIPRLRLLVMKGDARQERLGPALSDQLAAGGIGVDVLAFEPRAYAEAVKAGDYDLRIEQTYGLPYDPDLSLAARFLPSPGRTASTSIRSAVDPRLERLVRDALSLTDPIRGASAHGEIAAFLEEELPVLPLYVPHHVVVVRADLGEPRVGPDGYHLDLEGILRVPSR